jgi:membrane protease subunit HflK
MAWNEPGGGNQDPWGNRGGNQGPPDLDEIVRKMRDRMGGLFGGGKGGEPRAGGASGGSPFGVGLVVVLALLVWTLSGIYIIDPAERGVVLRFGRFVDMTAPGPHWHIPYPIETVEKVNIDEVRTVSHRAKMLTKDENIIQVELAVQYRIKDARDYLFKVRDPDYTLKEATESALREVIGNNKMDTFLSGGRGLIITTTEKLIQTMLDRYQTGLLLTSVNLQDPQPPEEVQGAFQDAIKAQEDEVRYKNQAEAYARDILPRARGDATRVREEAAAYKEQVIAGAEGETSRFLQTLREYAKAPEVTRKRLYLDSMQSVLSSSSKIMLQVDQGNNLLLLPLEKILEQTSAAEESSPQDEHYSRGVTGQAKQTPARRASNRERGTR